MAFQNRDGSKVLVVHNTRRTAMSLGVNVDEVRHLERIQLAPDEIATLKWR